MGLVTGKPENDLDKFLQNRLSEKDGGRDPGQKNGPRFFYVDRKGDIHFVADLNDIPYSYRSQAQKLER